MMTRNIRKVISIICAVALVLSLGVVALTGTTSAFKLGGTPVGSALNLNFENDKGVAQTNGFQGTGIVVDPDDAGNKVFKLVSGAAKNSKNWSPSKSADADTGIDNAFEIKPDTTYIITYKLKVGEGSGRNDSDEISVSLYRGTTSSASKNSLSASSKVSIAEADKTYIDANQWYITENTDWQEYSFTITTPADLAGNNHLFFVGIHSRITDHNNVYYFDDVKIDMVDEAEYEFDGEKGTTGEFWAPNKNGLLADSDIAGGSYVDAAGYHIRPITDTKSGYNQIATIGGTNYVKVMALRDPDVNNGAAVGMKAGHKYLLSMKYKIADIDDANSIRLSIGYIGSGSKRTVIVPIGEYDATTDWLYFETVIDGSTEPDGKNAYSGQEILILMANKNGTLGVCETLVESISLHEFKSDANLVMVKYNSNGGSYVATEVVIPGTVINPSIPTNADTNMAFAGWYLDAEFKNAVPANYAPNADVTLYAKWVNEYVNITFVCAGKETTTKLANGTALPRPERPHTRTFFLGWCTDKALTNIVTKAPGHNCTLYAKFDYMYTAFNQGGYSDKTNKAFTIVPEPGNTGNNVMKLELSKDVSSSNFEISVGDIEGAPAYELEANTKYMISFKYKIPATEYGGALTLYKGSQSAYTAATAKISTGYSIKWAAGDMKNGSEWITFTAYYTTGGSFYSDRVEWIEKNKLYFVFSGAKDDDGVASPALVYIDDLVVGPVTEETPKGATAIKFNTNGADLAPIFGYPGETILMPENPSISAHKFLGWYTDKNFQNKFTATTYGTEDIELYAKWELTEWMMNFDDADYNTKSTSGRFTVKEENGNKYLRYSYKDGAASSSSASTSFGRATFNRGGSEHYICSSAATYVITFKYKVVESTGENPQIRGLTSNKFSTWGNGVLQANPVTLDVTSTEWKTGSFTVNPKIKPETANFLGFAVNGDATILFDDFVIVPDIDTANIYGTTVISFDSNGGSKVAAIGGNPGEKIFMPKKPTRSGYVFKGWYTDSSLTTKFTETKYGETNIQLVAGWALGKLNENFENLPARIQVQGISGAYVYYKNGVEGYDAANVKDGTTSIFRKADVAGSKGFTICRDASMTLDVGSQYTLTMHVKPTAVGDAAGTINLISMSTNTAISAPDSTDVITTVGELKAGEWQEITYTFTAKEQFIGISSSEGNELYFDAISVNIVGYTGSDTGDTSVSPIIITVMVLLTAGALLITGKKVFSK